MDHRDGARRGHPRVRNRWRLQLALRGAVVVVAGTLLALLLSASGLEALRFSAARHHRLPHHRRLRCSRRWCCYGLVWPLRRRVTDAQVALYLEEAIRRSRRRS